MKRPLLAGILTAALVMALPAPRVVAQGAAQIQAAIQKLLAGNNTWTGTNTFVNSTTTAAFTVDNGATGSFIVNSTGLSMAYPTDISGTYISSSSTDFTVAGGSTLAVYTQSNPGGMSVTAAGKTTIFDVGGGAMILETAAQSSFSVPTTGAVAVGGISITNPAGIVEVFDGSGSEFQLLNNGVAEIDGNVQVVALTSKFLFQSDHVDNHGVHVSTLQTTPPTCSSNCGTGSPTVTGSDTSGIITLGTTPASGFVVTFNTAWDVAPACTAVMAKAGMVVGKLPLTVVATTTTVTIVTNGTAPDTGDLYVYHCVGVA